MFVLKIITQSAVEAFDERIPVRLPKLDQSQLDALQMRVLYRCLDDELRTSVRPDSLRFVPKRSRVHP